MSFARNGQGSHSRVKCRNLVVPMSVDEEDAPVSMQVEVRAAEVHGCREPGFSDVDSIIRVFLVLGLGFSMICKRVENLGVISCEAPSSGLMSDPP